MPLRCGPGPGSGGTPRQAGRVDHSGDPNNNSDDSGRSGRGDDHDASPKPVEIGKRLVIQRMSATSTTLAPTTTTTTEAPKTPLEVAQSQVGKTGSYADGGFWCARFVSYVAEQTHVEGFEQSDSPARLYAVAKEQGRLTDTPQPGYLVFIDLTGQNFANQYVSHVGIVESVDGATVHTIEGNADDSGVVTRQTRQVGDGYVVGFVPFTG
jgi:surface antigen